MGKKNKNNKKNVSTHSIYLILFYRKSYLYVPMIAWLDSNRRLTNKRREIARKNRGKAGRLGLIKG